MPFLLGEDDWRRLKEIAHLPDGPRLPDRAGLEVENILRMAKFIAEFDATAIPPHVTRERLTKLWEKAKALRKDLRGCEPDALRAFISSGYEAEPPNLTWVQPRSIATDFLLYSHLKALDSLIERIDRARGEVSKGKTGNKTSTAQYVAREIDALLERHKMGFRLTPAEKSSDPGRELLTACFKLLKIDIKSEAAIRRMASGRNLRSSRSKKTETSP